LAGRCAGAAIGAALLLLLFVVVVAAVVGSWSEVLEEAAVDATEELLCLDWRWYMGGEGGVMLT